MDWKNAGKEKIKYLHTRALEWRKQEVQKQAQRRKYSLVPGGPQALVVIPPPTKFSHKEMVAAYASAFTLCDLDMESDLFAMAFYKFEFETTDHKEVSGVPRMEIVKIYNT